ncbi:MAG: DNA polymerase [Bacillota bacterium]
MQLRLNLAQANGEDKTAATARVKAAADKRKQATETMAEAWARILAMKNSESDRQRLTEVRVAMESGAIGRNPADIAKRFSKAEALRMYKELAESQREQKLADLVANTPANYRLITTERQFGELLEDLQGEDIIALDTETTGLDVYIDVIVGVSITLPKADYHVYIPIKPTEDDRAMDSAYVLEGLREYLEDGARGKVLHNAIFDVQMLRRHGITLRGIAWDSMTAMHLLNENEPSYKLKDLAPKFLGAESDTFDQLFGKNAKFAEVPLDLALVYAAKDTHLTWDLYRFQDAHMRKMPEMYDYYKSVEVPLLSVIADLEANGYILDLDFAKEYGEKLRQEAEELHAYLIAELTPHHDSDEPLNLNSPHQVKPALSKAIGRNLPNLDAKRTLKPLKGEFEVIAKLLEYKRITKLSGTYIDKLPTKQNAATKRWHSRFNPMGTVTGRFSSGKDEDSGTDQQFNVQNQPKDARKMFVAPPGKVIIGADFSAQEIRCVANLSGEQVLIDAFENGKDPYAWVASMYYKKPYHEVYKDSDGSDTPERKQFKTVVLAYIYGTSKWGLADQLGTTPDAAEKLMNDLSSELPRLAEWVKETQQFATKHGFVWIGGKKRKRRLPDAMLKAKWGDRETYSKVNRAKRQGPNSRVQGESSIQAKKTMIEAAKMCREKGPDWSLWGVVHDEVLFEAPNTLTQEDIRDVERVMTESYVFGNIPNKTDIEIMTIWGKGVPAEKWFANKEENE